MTTVRYRRRSYRRRRYARRQSTGLFAQISVERLEPRLLLSDLPRVTAHDLADYTTERITDLTLTLSEPVVAADARDASNYQLLHLGADRVFGGGDDRSIGLAPIYVDGSTQIEFSLETEDTIDLGHWNADGHLRDDGSLNLVVGTWELDSDVANAVHVSTPSDYPSYFVTDYDLIDEPFQARVRVDSDTSDDMIGLIFGLQHRFYGSENEYDYGPDTFYVLTWKQTTEDKEVAPGYVYTAEEGLKLLRFENFAGSKARGALQMLWDGDYTWGDRMSVLDTHLGDDTGWEPHVEYGFSLWQHGDGTIELSVKRTSDGAVIWQTTVQDPEPLPAGPVGFLNLGVPQARYAHTVPVNYLPDGTYEFRAGVEIRGCEDSMARRWTATTTTRPAATSLSPPRSIGDRWRSVSICRQRATPAGRPRTT